MLFMNLIVAVDKNWGIGANNNLLYNLKQDLAFFKKQTTNKIVVMGQTTLESLPGGKPLPNRTNVVLSKDPNYTVPNATVLHGLSELFIWLNNNVKDQQDVYIIGGASIYQQLLPYCKTAYITKIYASKQADTFFPNLNDHENWKELFVSPPQTEQGVEFAFSTYINLNPLTY